MASNLSNTTLTQEDVEALKEACLHFYPVELLGDDYLGMRATSWAINTTNLHYNWKSSTSFLKDLFTLTGGHSVKEAFNFLNNWEVTATSEAPSHWETTSTEDVAQRPQQPASTLPSEIWLREKVEEIEKKELSNQTKNLLTQAKRNPQTFSQVMAQEMEKRYLEKVPGLSSEEQKIVSLNAQTSAYDLTQKLLTFEEPQVDEVSALATLANPNDKTLEKFIADKDERFEIAKAAQEKALIQEHDFLISQKMSSLVLEEEALKEIYFEKKYEISDTPTGLSLKPQDLFATYKDQGFSQAQEGALDLNENLQESFSQGTEAFKTIIKETPWYGKAQNFFAQRATQFLTSRGIVLPKVFTPAVESRLLSFWKETQVPILASTKVVRLFPATGARAMVVPIINTGFLRIASRTLTVGGKTLSGLSIRFGGIRITSLLAKEASGQITSGLIKLTTQAGTKIFSSTALAGTLGTISSFFATPLGGVVIAAVSYVAGELLSKVIEKIPALVKKIKDNAPVIFGMGAILFVPGALMGSFVLMGPGFILMATPIVAGGIGAAGIGGLGLRVGSLFFGGFLLPMVIIPVVIGFIAFVVLTVFILFIINSGAYLVPANILSSENPYVKIEKVPDPNRDFKNDELSAGFVVEYTITATSKKSTLSNISFEYSCEVVKEKTSVKCPDITEGEIPNLGGEGGENPTRLEPSKSISFKYKVRYNNHVYDDTLITDTITIKADVEDGTKLEAATSATIKIGNPPEECPINAWPIAGEGGASSVTQGPHAKGCSHSRMSADAIDIGVNGATVIATHSGIVSVAEDNCYGKHIDIRSTCGSTVFSSRYAHLGIVYVRPGQRVTRGQPIAISDNTGANCTTGPHLHFDFRSSSGGAVSVPKMSKPYLIRDIPYGCCNSYNGIYCNQ